jgi:vacuolar-type H+-ATPase subunit H
MSTELQSDYASELKAIKEKEEETIRQITQRKKDLEIELHRSEDESNRTVADARSSAEKLVSQEVEKARVLAQKDVEKLLQDKKQEAQRIASRRISDSEIRKIIDDVLLSEFKM